MGGPGWRGRLHSVMGVWACAALWSVHGQWTDGGHSGTHTHSSIHSPCTRARIHEWSWSSHAYAHTPASDDGHKIQVSDAGCEYRRGTACEPSPCERGRRRGLHIPGVDAPKFTILVHAGSAGGAERSGRRRYQVALCYADSKCL